MIWPFNLFIRPKYKYKRVMNPKDMAAIGKVHDWQERQKTDYEWNISRSELSKKYITPLTGIRARWAARSILKKVQRKMHFVRDIENYGMSDYWATAEEVLSTHRDDCDGFAVALWAYLTNYNFSEMDIGMVYVHGHMFACWHEDGNDDDFWVLDNGFMTTSMVKASKFFPIKRKDNLLEPIYGFNAKRWWDYKKIKEVD